MFNTLLFFALVIFSTLFVLSNNITDNIYVSLGDDIEICNSDDETLIYCTVEIHNSNTFDIEGQNMEIELYRADSFGYEKIGTRTGHDFFLNAHEHYTGSFQFVVPLDDYTEDNLMIKTSLGLWGVLKITRKDTFGEPAITD